MKKFLSIGLLALTLTASAHAAQVLCDSAHRLRRPGKLW